MLCNEVAKCLAFITAYTYVWIIILVHYGNIVVEFDYWTMKILEAV